MKKIYLKPSTKIYQICFNNLLNNVSDVEIGGEGELDAKSNNRNRRDQNGNWNNLNDWEDDNQEEVQF